MKETKKPESWSASVSSSREKHSISVRLSALLTAILVLLLAVACFYGGTVYERSTISRPSNTPSAVINRHFALGLVVYSSSNSITIDNERTGNSHSYKITSSTLISINGSRATATQIKAGDIVLLRFTKNNQAAVILVNSNFSD